MGGGRRGGRYRRCEEKKESGTGWQGPADKKWFSWKLAFFFFVRWVNGARCLGAYLGLAAVTAAQMSIKLEPIYCWFARVICNISFPPLTGWRREARAIEEENGGKEEMEGESLYCSLSAWMSSAHLSRIPVGRKEERWKERRSFVPPSGSLAHANKAAASGERLARVLMELGQTHFTAQSHRRGG